MPKFEPIARRWSLFLFTSLYFTAAGADWNYETRKDPMGRGDIKTARVSSVNQVSFDFPYGGPQRGFLELRVHPQWGRDVMLHVQKGQFLCRRDDCSLLVRFDDKAPMRFSGAEPADNSSNTVFIQGYARFLEGVSKANIVRIEAMFYRQGTRIFEFNVSGLKWETPTSKKSGSKKQPETADKGADQKEAQRDRMRKCNDGASARQLRGDERMQFMASCLKGEDTAMSEQKKLQMERMRSCNADAANQRLVGDERRAFMASCIKNDN